MKLEYTSVAFRAVFNEQLYILTIKKSCNYNRSSILKTMAQSIAVNTIFYVGSQDFIIFRWPSIQEVFINGVDNPMIYIRTQDLIIDLHSIVMEDRLQE